jgi:ketosteroid isomerase-like protein
VAIVAQELHERQHGVALVVGNKDAQPVHGRAIVFAANRASPALLSLFPLEKRALFRYVTSFMRWSARSAMQNVSVTIRRVSMESTDWQAEIVAVEEAANTAFLKRDLARLDQLFSEELLFNSPINIVNDKQKLLDLLGAGVIGHVSSAFKHELVRRDGDLVIVMGSDTVKNSPTEPALRRRFTNIWRKEGDRWRLYIRHANVIASG